MYIILFSHYYNMFLQQLEPGKVKAMQLSDLENKSIKYWVGRWLLMKFEEKKCRFAALRLPKKVIMNVLKTVIRDMRAPKSPQLEPIVSLRLICF